MRSLFFVFLSLPSSLLASNDGVISSLPILLSLIFLNLLSVLFRSSSNKHPCLTTTLFFPVTKSNILFV